MQHSFSSMRRLLGLFLGLGRKEGNATNKLDPALPIVKDSQEMLALAHQRANSALHKDFLPQGFFFLGILPLSCVHFSFPVLKVI